MKTIRIQSDLPCAVVKFDGELHSHRKVAYFMFYDEAVSYTSLVSKFSRDYFAVVFFFVNGAKRIEYYRNGEMMEGFVPEVRYECI